MSRRKAFWKKNITYSGLFTTVIVFVIFVTSLTAYAERSDWRLNGSNWPDQGGCGGGGIEFYKYSGNDPDFGNVHITYCSDRQFGHGDHVTWEGDPRYAFYGYTHNYVGNPPQHIVDILNRAWLDWRTVPEKPCKNPRNCL